jgi:hypothetical protein
MMMVELSISTMCRGRPAIGKWTATLAVSNERPMRQFAMFSR